MAKNLKLLLTENVESLGIVGDVVNVRVGYARNFLMPRNMATTPSDEAIAAVAAKRAEAQRQLAALRKERESLIEKMSAAHITLIRSCNELGHLYASITQQEIATALSQAGYPGVRPRDVRLNQSIKRVDNYDIHIKFDADLDATIKLTVAPDRKLDLPSHEPTPEPTPEGAEGAVAAEGAAPAEGEAKAEPKAKREKGESKAKGEPKDRAEAKEKPEAKSKDEAGAEAKPEKGKGKDAGEKKPKKDRGVKDQSADVGPAVEKKTGGGWGTPVSKPTDFGLPPPRRGGKRH